MTGPTSDLIQVLTPHTMEKFSAYRVGAISLPPIYADLHFSRTQEPEYRYISNSTHNFPLTLEFSAIPDACATCGLGISVASHLAYPICPRFHQDSSHPIHCTRIRPSCPRCLSCPRNVSHIFLSRPSSFDFLIAPNPFIIPISRTHIHLYSRTISTSHPWYFLDLT